MSKQKSMGFIDFSKDEVLPQGQTSTSYRPQGMRCHESHPDLVLPNGGTLVGGNCWNHKRHTEVDLYVALDTSQSHPEFEVGIIPARCVYYPIRNMDIPKRPDKFAALVDMICSVLSQQGKVHIGCIGGHGRTGMVLAAVISKLGLAGPDNDAIQWVRDNYCKKAVETKEQEGFLVVNFGVKMHNTTKTPYQTGTGPRS